MSSSPSSIEKVATMNDSSDQQYQEQQLEQLKLETSQISSSVSTDSSHDKPLTDQGINEIIVQKIRSCIDSGKLTSTDIDNRVCEQFRSFPDDLTSVDSVFDEFNNSDLTNVVNKSAFLCNLIKQWKLRHSQSEQKSTNHNSSTEPDSNDTLGKNSTKHKPGPDEEKLKQITDRTGYSVEVTAGQRKYGGPPPDGPDRPAPNSEVFIGKLPREIFEDELIPLCEEAGRIWDLRLMVDPASGFNKGYCFVTFCDQADSVKAVEKLNGFAIRPGKIIKANGSVANTRLFIGNIPKTKSKDEIKDELVKLVEGVVNVIVYTPADEADKKKNRGFCFVDFDTHKNASVARRKLSNGRVRLFNRDIATDWADPDEEPDDSTMSQVKVLYVRNLTSEVSENDVNDLFLPYGNIERVRKVRDYAFVHFDERDDALNAMRSLNGKILGRNAMEISLAKPMSDKRKQAQIKREQRKQFDPPGSFRPDPDNRPSPNQLTTPPPFGAPPHRPSDSFNSSNFGAFAGDTPMTGNNSRGGSSNRGFRGGSGAGGRRGRNNNDRGSFADSRNGNNGVHFNQNNRGGYRHSNNNNNNYHRGNNYNGPPPSQPTFYNNSNNFHNQNDQMGRRYNNGFNNQNPFGAFSGPTQNNSNSFVNRPSNPNHFGLNSMGSNQQYSGMKRPQNQMNDSNMSKRARSDTGSWGSMTGENSTTNNHGQQQQQQQSAGNWYQDQSYHNSQQQTNYSWN